MILFFSGGGGSRNYNPETILEKGAVMLTFFINVRPDNTADHRFKDILREKRLNNRRSKSCQKK